MRHLLWPLLLVFACKGGDKPEGQGSSPQPTPTSAPAPTPTPAPPTPTEPPPPPKPVADMGVGACQYISLKETSEILGATMEFRRVNEDIRFPCMVGDAKDTREINAELHGELVDDSFFQGTEVEKIGDKTVLSADGNLYFMQGGKGYRVIVYDNTPRPVVPLKDETIAVAKAIAKRLEANPPK